ESPWGNLAADALLKHMEADVAILMSGLLPEGLPQGEVTAGDLNRACFTTANPYLSYLTGSQLVEALERALDPEVCTRVVTSFRGPPVGFPQISGMQVAYQKAGKVRSKIREVLIHQTPLDPGKSYKVAHTDAEISANYGYFELAPGMESNADVPTILPDVLAEYLINLDSSALPKPGRWVGI
ncbi:MAG: 5'-nucleotidase, partial [Anaerolineales bacterium]|nr:5'-nucleotidase [Anaerolineales bacterium]